MKTGALPRVGLSTIGCCIKKPRLKALKVKKRPNLKLIIKNKHRKWFVLTHRFPLAL